MIALPSQVARVSPAVRKACKGLLEVRVGLLENCLETGSPGVRPTALLLSALASEMRSAALVEACRITGRIGDATT